MSKNVNTETPRLIAGMDMSLPLIQKSAQEEQLRIVWCARYKETTHVTQNLKQRKENLIRQKHIKPIKEN